MKTVRPVCEESSRSLVGALVALIFLISSSAWAQEPLEYEDTEFGEILYNESSTPTRLEILRLLSKETPSLLVFLTALSMGVDMDSLIDAAVRYQPDKSRDFAASAVTVLPLLDGSRRDTFSGYELDDLNRQNKSSPYSVLEVVERFFEERATLRPYPDWLEGQFHFMASAKELKTLLEDEELSEDWKWYRSKSNAPRSPRPVFVSLYEDDKTVLIDGAQKISNALAQDVDALLPVVFIFNRLAERAVDEIEQEKTIRGVQQAYALDGLMLTPTPEWEMGEYHIYADMDEVNELFEIPEEDDFEPEDWTRLLNEARAYVVNDTSFLVIVLDGGDGESTVKALNTKRHEYASWEDPRKESAFPYVSPDGDEDVSLRSLLGRGLIINRPDLISALNSLGVREIPIAFYYIDSLRVSPYSKSPRSLIQSILGIQHSPIELGGSGGLTLIPPPSTPPPPEPPVCASPPCL